MGILVMLLVFCFVILVHELGHWLVARMCGARTPVFSIGFGAPYLRLGRFWDTEFRITPWLLGGYVMILELGDESSLANEEAAESSESTGDGANSRAKARPPMAIWKRALIASAGVVMNLITAIVVLFSCLAFIGRPVSFEPTSVYVYSLDRKNPIASNAGIQRDDVITEVAGVKVKSAADLRRALADRKKLDTELVLDRAGKRVVVHVVPDADGRIGIAPVERGNTKYERLPPGKAALGSVLVVAEACRLQVQGIGMLLGLVPKPADLPDQALDVRGPIGIVQIGASMWDMGLFPFLMFVAMLNVVVAVMNILPVPVLDGGYLLFLLVEKVRGKPIDARVRQGLLLFFMACLLALGGYAIINDIVNPVR